MADARARWMGVWVLSAGLAVWAAPQKTLVFLGDSLTAGYGLRQGEAFPERIAARLPGGAWKVVNAGASGDTSSGALRRMDWILRQRVDVLFVCIGANDGLRGIPPESTEANVRQIVSKAQTHGAKVVLAGMRLPENYGPEHRRRFEAIYPRLAKELKLPFLAFLLEDVAMRPELNQADGIHPTAEGQRRIADRVWRFLQPVLGK